MVFVRTESGKPGPRDRTGSCGLRERPMASRHPPEDRHDRHGRSARLAVARAISEGSAFSAAAGSVTSESSSLAEDTNGRLIGLVASDTNVGQLQIELVRTDLDLQEGSLVEVEIKGRPVLYQVIKGLTKEEVLQEKNTRGFVRAQAKKIGFWNNDRRSFDPVPWLPQPNQAVLLVRPKQEATEKDAIGHFPGTSYPVAIDQHLLVTHNAAILGILGVGKSYLALELVERMISAGTKVVCLDLTNQYADELATFLDADARSCGTGRAGEDRSDRQNEREEECRRRRKRPSVHCQDHRADRGVPGPGEPPEAPDLESRAVRSVAAGQQAISRSSVDGHANAHGDHSHHHGIDS